MNAIQTIGNDREIAAVGVQIAAVVIRVFNVPFPCFGIAVIVYGPQVVEVFFRFIFTGGSR